jgi:hypothetical protein
MVASMQDYASDELAVEILCAPGKRSAVWRLPGRRTQWRQAWSRIREQDADRRCRLP